MLVTQSAEASARVAAAQAARDRAVKEVSMLNCLAHLLKRSAPSCDMKGMGLIALEESYRHLAEAVCDYIKFGASHME